MKKAKLIALAASFAVLGSTGIAMAGVQPTQTQTLTGHISATLLLGKQYPTTFMSFLERPAQNITSITKEQFDSAQKNGLKFSNSWDGTSSTTQKLASQYSKWLINHGHSSLKKDASGDYAFTTPMPNLQVTVGGETTTADAAGNFTVNLAPGEYTLTVKDPTGKSLMKQETVNIVSGESSLDVAFAPQTIEQGFANMSRGMDMSSKTMSSNMNMSTNSIVTPNSTPQVYGYIGTGLGKMEVVSPYGQVNCNKSWNDNGASFPNNSSDCSVSISYGLLYADYASSDPWDYGKYSDNYYCQIEAVKNAYTSSMLPGNEGSNPYCDGVNDYGQKPIHDWIHNGTSPYSNQGFNCSSFPQGNHDSEGLNHDSSPVTPA